MKKSVKSFFGQNLFIIISFLLPMAIMTACFVLNRIIPFGDNAIMVKDAWHQYYPFLREFQTLLKEGNLPLYSFNTGGGSDFLGVVGNYVASPLYWLSVFLPDSHRWLIGFLGFTVVLRIGFAGGFMALFLRKLFNRNDLSLVYFSLSYAFCGFILGYYWNVMWLDSVALLPVVVWGAYSVLKEGRFKLYIIALALSVICSFYIGFFICIFVLLFSICYTLINWKGMGHSLKNAGKMAVFTLVAFMLTAFITLPTYMALSHSDSAADALGFPLHYSINYAYGYNEANTLLNTLKAFVRTFTNLLSFTRPIIIDKGAPNIFCGALCLFLSVFYFLNKKISLKEKLVSGSLCLFIMSSFVINQLNYIWHGFNTPAMVYYRFSFVFSFVLIVLSYRAFCLVEGMSKKSFIFAGIFFLLYLAAAFLFQRKLSVAITAAALAFLGVLFLLLRKRKLKKRVVSLLLCLFVICEMGLSAAYGTRVVGYTDALEYPFQAEELKSALSFAENESEGELYRTEFVNAQTLNDGALNSVYGISTFNSMCRRDYTDFFAEFGLAASVKNNRYEYVEGTPVENLFLNIKYLAGRARLSTEDEMALVEEEVVDSSFMSLVFENQGINLYENTAYIPMGFMTDKKLLSYELSEKAKLPHIAQNELFSLATGIEEDVLVPVDESRVSGVDLSGMTHHKELLDYYTYTREASADEALSVEYEIPKDGSYYGLFRYTDEDDDDIIINCGDRQVRDNGEYSHIVALGEMKKGEKVSVDLPLAQKDGGKLGYFLFYFDKEVFDKGYEKLSRNFMTLTEKTSIGIKGSIKTDEDGLFYLSVLYDEGFKAFVDGKEVEITPVSKTFCAFELEEGEHTIELRFTPEGMYAGLAVSLAGILAFALLLIIYKKEKRNL